MQPPSLDWIDTGSRPGHYHPLHLEDARDRLAALEDQLAPVDFEVGVDELDIRFCHGTLQTTLRDSGDVPMDFTEHAASRLARDVLPPRFLGGLQQLSLLSGQGDQLATDTWGEFARRKEQPRLVRTARLPNTDHRMVRSCHSTAYAPYSNVQLVEDLLSADTGFSDMDVLDLRVSDRAMRLRLVRRGQELEPAIPIPMIEIWNSEVGLRRVSIQGGTWRLICANGLGDWDEDCGQHWIHRGCVDRIRDELGHAAERVSQSVQRLLDAWYQGWDVLVPHPLDWLESQLTGRLAPRLLEPVLNHHSGPLQKVTPLTDLVESITRLAQDQRCLLDQREMERHASLLLKIGLSHPPAIA
jgi:hypothetical protein